PERERFLRGMFAWVGFRQVPFAYDRDARAAGATKYPLVKMMALALTAITNFSTAPLRLASHLGLAATVLSLALVVYVM
ncbi:glycosyltransferase, partial [Klebsiella pneumoniae]|nr:glycosyltransferase [Klebsiella pneumoniae]